MDYKSDKQLKQALSSATFSRLLTEGNENCSNLSVYLLENLTDDEPLYDSSEED